MTHMRQDATLPVLEPAAPVAGIAADGPGRAPQLTATAILFDGDSHATCQSLALNAPESGDVIADVLWSGISTGTERLMWEGAMPPFPGMGYPLVPGYEAVGRIIWAEDTPERVGEFVFLPGASCFKGARGLFGASASRLVVKGAKAHTIRLADPREGALLALAATAHHAVDGPVLPDLIIGHGVLGRLAARLVMALGGPAPTVWETNPRRRDSQAYPVIDPQTDERRNYRCVCDMSGDAGIIDKVLPHLARGSEIILAGFYAQRPSFAFPLAFMKEMRLRVAAEWTLESLKAVSALAESGQLGLGGLITHSAAPAEAAAAYARAFSDPDCLKMLIDWRPGDA